MKKHHLLSLCATLSVFGAAQAATITIDSSITSGDQFYTTASSGSLQFDASLISTLGTAGINFSAVAPATYDSSTARVSTSVSRVNYDSSTNRFTSLGTVGGGAFDMPRTSFIFGIRVGGPGNVSFTDLTINLATSTVSAFVTGTNGVTAGTYDIFSFGSLTGNTTFNGAGTYSLAANQLVLTSTGVNLVAQGLNLSNTGRNVLGDVTNLGTLSGSFTVAAVPAPVVPTPAIPEPSTYALMGLGLVGIALAARRRQKTA